MNYIGIPGLKGRRTIPVIGRPETNEERATHILSVIMQYYSLSETEILSKKRDRRICQPRQIMIYLIHKTTSMSLHDIAKFAGGRDHSTAIHARDTIEDLIETDLLVRDDVNHLRCKI